MCWEFGTFAALFWQNVGRYTRVFAKILIEIIFCQKSSRKMVYYIVKSYIWYVDFLVFFGRVFWKKGYISVFIVTVLRKWPQILSVLEQIPNVPQTIIFLFSGYELPPIRCYVAIFEGKACRGPRKLLRNEEF